ncbi:MULTISPECIES: MbtH family protein [Streptomyces]|uniref:MbtH family protein n=1 Tax=Streptomyces TaxID=1883 RepID=UPI001CEDB2F0|nr:MULTISPECIES: MbtH family protein [Streptomyces]MDI6408417.1 MbtH family protein [Streptomyces albus]
MPDGPFDDPEGRYTVLANDNAELSLWPAWRPVPDGWRAVLAETDRQACLRYVAAHWRVTTAQYAPTRSVHA